MALDLIVLGKEAADIGSKRPLGWDRWPNGARDQIVLEFGTNSEFDFECDSSVNLAHIVCFLRCCTALKIISDFSSQSLIVFDAKEVAGITENPLERDRWVRGALFLALWVVQKPHNTSGTGGYWCWYWWRYWWYLDQGASWDPTML